MRPRPAAVDREHSRAARTWLARRPRPQVAIAAGVICAVADLLVRALLAPYLGGEERFAAMFPALLAATFVGGSMGGGLCLGVSLVGGWFLFIGPPRSFALGQHEAAGLFVLFCSGAAVLAATVWVRRLTADLEAANVRQHDLALELQHRVKNNLAVVEAMAVQTLRVSMDLDQFREAFLGRLRSLAAAHTLLSDVRGSAASMDEIVARTLGPFRVGSRIRMSGEELQLEGSAVTALTMCLHELATNAVKYGALSNGSGVVTVTWRRAGPHLAQVQWREDGGPPVRPPTRQGLGTRLLKRGLVSSEPPTLDYAETGVAWCSLAPVLDAPQGAAADPAPRPSAAQPLSEPPSSEPSPEPPLPMSSGR